MMMVGINALNYNNINVINIMNPLKQIILIALGTIILTALGNMVYNKGKTDLITHLEQYGHYQSTKTYLICVVKPNKDVFEYNYTPQQTATKE